MSGQDGDDNINILADTAGDEADTVGGGEGRGERDRLNSDSDKKLKSETVFKMTENEKDKR